MQLLFALIMFAPLFSCSSNSATKVQQEKEIATDTVKKMPYNLAIPAGWTTETIVFPISFAPSISYSGTEDLRFAKGWGNAASDEHWTYAFLWWLDGEVVIDTATLREDLTSYYSGLVQQNIKERNIPAVKIVATTVEVKAAVALPGDKSTFAATVHMLDYLAQEPIVLHCIIHVKQCAAKDHTAILFTVSPAERDHAVWQQLNAISGGFTCTG